MHRTNLVAFGLIKQKRSLTAATGFQRSTAITGRLAIFALVQRSAIYKGIGRTARIAFQIYLELAICTFPTLVFIEPTFRTRSVTVELHALGGQIVLAVSFWTFINTGAFEHTFGGIITKRTFICRITRFAF